MAENDQNYVIELFTIAKQLKNTVTVFYFNVTDKSQKLKNLLHIVGRNDIEDLMKKKRLVFVKIEDNPITSVLNSLPKNTPSALSQAFGQ